MPECPIIDAHVHLWDPQRLRLAWLDASPLLNRPYDLDTYAQHSEGLEIEALVYVEVGAELSDALREAQAVAALAATEPRLQGIVAAASLEQGQAVRDHLSALHALGPRVKGVRRILQAEPDPEFCLRPGFVQATQLLPEFGFSFDICITHGQLPAATELVRRCPHTQFILDHCAKPNIRGAALDPWRADIAALAAQPNVVCKVSGLVTEANHSQWTTADLAPYVGHVLEQFGEDRVLFGGDWPVALMASPYRRWVEALDALTAHLSGAAQRKLWADNARRVYRL